MPPKKAIAKKPKKEKDPNAPKRPKSAYMEYAIARRPQIIKDTPDIAFGAIGKQMGEEWRGMSDADKAPYQAKADKAKAKYEKEKAKYDAKKK